MKSKEKKILLILIIALVAIDQILKIVFLATQAKLGNTNGWNLGILEQNKSENNIQYILIGIIAAMALIRYITRNNIYIKMDSKVVISFAIAGCISNLIDRIWNGGVINYINIPKFTSMNLGYIYIAITWIGMAVILTKHTSKAIIERRTKNQIEKCPKKDRPQWTKCAKKDRPQWGKKEVEDEKRNNSK